ncbi:hypothetical protein SCH4B_0213 [Ruegeria sp. TrichCH4B]|nr:hypothetical protein SCH4B_0213 [Ruegeria sp. TrichCH4B]
MKTEFSVPIGSQPLKLAAFGTCRLHNSLKLLEGSGHVTLLPAIAGFSHSSAEINQHIDIALGNKPLPNEAMKPLGYTAALNRNLNTTAELRGTIDPADIVLIEISSLKLYKHKDYYGQSNRISEHLGVPVSILDSALLHGDYSQVPDKKLHALAEFEARIQDLPECRKTLKEILAKLAPKPIILLNHFLVEPDPNGRFIARRRLRAMLKRLREENPERLFHFDPTPLLRRFNWPIEDMAHYEESFKHVVALELRRYLAQAVLPVSKGLTA